MNSLFGKPGYGCPKGGCDQGRRCTCDRRAAEPDPWRASDFVMAVMLVAVVCAISMGWLG